jgi:hypothetical protein
VAAPGSSGATRSRRAGTLRARRRRPATSSPARCPRSRLRASGPQAQADPSRAAAQRRHGRPDTRQHADAPADLHVHPADRPQPFQAQREAGADPDAHRPAAPPEAGHRRAADHPQPDAAADPRREGADRRQRPPADRRHARPGTRRPHPADLRPDPPRPRHGPRPPVRWSTGSARTRSSRAPTRPTTPPSRAPRTARRTSASAAGTSRPSTSPPPACSPASSPRKAAPGLQADTQPRPLRQERVQGRRHHRHRPVHRRSHARRARQGRRDRPPRPRRPARARARGGHGQGDVEDWKHPAKYLTEHPLLFALDVSGAGSAVGRTAGAFGRAAGSSGPARSGPPRALTHDLAGGIVEQRGSKDLIRREFQRSSDNRAPKLKDAEGNDVMVEQGGRRVPVLAPNDTLRGAILHPKVGATGHLNNKRGDMLAGRANSAERLARDEEGKERAGSAVSGAGTRRRSSRWSRAASSPAPRTWSRTWPRT